MIPKIIKSTIAIIIILMGFIALPAFAQTQILDNIADNYARSSINWFEPLFNMAQKLFFALAAIELAWSGIIWSLEKDEMSSYTISHY
jgi:type IV secretory pathway TrbL component